MLSASRIARSVPTCCWCNRPAVETAAASKASAIQRSYSNIRAAQRIRRDRMISRYNDPHNPDRRQKGRPSPRQKEQTDKRLTERQPDRDPFLLVSWLRNQIRIGNINEAVAAVDRAPASALNAACYNVVIFSLIKADRYKDAWRLWMDMKRSGVIPTTHSYTAFFTSNKRQFAMAPSACENVDKVFQQFLNHIPKLREQGVDEHHISIPANAYMNLVTCTMRRHAESVLGISKMLDAAGIVWTVETYTIVFQYLADFLNTSQGHKTPPDDDLVRMLMERIERAIEAHRDNVIRMDQFMLSGIVKVWRRFVYLEIPGFSAIEAIETLADLTGLPYRQEHVASGLYPLSERVPLDAQVLRGMMLLANTVRTVNPDRFRYSQEWMRCLKNANDPAMQGLLNAGHCESAMYDSVNGGGEKILSWMIQSGQAQVRPTALTYQVAIRNSQWAGALRIMGFLTGNHDMQASQAPFLPKSLEDDPEVQAMRLPISHATITDLLKVAMRKSTPLHGKKIILAVASQFLKTEAAIDLGAGAADDKANLKRVMTEVNDMVKPTDPGRPTSEKENQLR